MIRKLKTLLGKDGFRKNDLLLKLGLKGLINDEVVKKEELKKGKEITIVVPESFHNCKIKKWNFKKGDIVDYGDIIGVIENDEHTMEFESFHLGEIYYINKTKLTLNSEDILLKIKGI